MHNVNVVVKPDETATDLIEQICLSENIGYDDPFAFSAILVENKLKINCIETDNPFTPVALITQLFKSEKAVKYVVPPLEIYLTTYKPMLYKMVNKAYPYYQKLIPDRDDLMSTLLLCIVKLHSKGYYLHNTLIYKCFTNDLNMEIRKLKHFTDCQSLDTPIGQDEDGKTITLADRVECPKASEEARQQYTYTERDYWEDMFDRIKDAMLQDMSQLSFDRILIQLKSKTITTEVSRTLTRYRKEFNPTYIPRPRARK